MAMGIKTTMGIDYDFIKTEEAKRMHHYKRGGLLRQKRH